MVACVRLARFGFADDRIGTFAHVALEEANVGFSVGFVGSAGDRLGLMSRKGSNDNPRSLGHKFRLRKSRVMDV
jgi:hypothetical protein